MADRTPPRAHRWTKEELYEVAVTNAEALVRFLAAVHGGTPRTLREDFSGTGALARAWASSSPVRDAIAVDRDARVLRRASVVPRCAQVARDVHACTARSDILAATNFPVGYFHARDALITYLRHARRCVRPGGVFVCDMYGGDGAFTRGTQRRTLRLSDSTRCIYHWEQRTANAATGLVENAIHFELHDSSGTVRQFRNAFVYHWRLWGIAELRDAMHDAGFAQIDVYDRLGDALDSEGKLHVHPLRADDELDPTWVVYIAARAKHPRTSRLQKGRGPRG